MTRVPRKIFYRTSCCSDNTFVIAGPAMDVPDVPIASWLKDVQFVDKECTEVPSSRVVRNELIAVRCSHAVWIIHDRAFLYVRVNHTCVIIRGRVPDVHVTGALSSQLGVCFFVSNANLSVLPPLSPQLYFSASWCPPCQRFLPKLIK